MRTLLLTILLVASLIAQPTPAQESRTVLTLGASKENPRNSEGDFIRLKNGTLLFIYTHFTGGGADEASAHLAGRISTDAGLTWNDHDFAVPAARGKQNTMSVSLLRLASGEVALFYLVKNSWSDCRPYMQTSADECKTWSDPRPCVTHPDYYVVNNARVIQTSTGRLIIPAALHRGANGRFQPRAAALCLFSDDNGKTWRASKSTLEAPKDSRTGLQEPAIIELKKGRLMMLCRTDQKCQMRSFSNDNGDTWSAVENSNIKSPVSPASIVRIPKTGHLLLVWNNNDRTPRRTPLSAAISKDEGKTWSTPRDLETDPKGHFCYTAICFTDDRLLLAYCAGSKPGDLSTTRITTLKLDSIDP
jgi:predicted neuraminidase